MPTVLTNPTAAKWTCLGCGLVCDDIEQQDAKLNVECDLAERFFAERHPALAETCRIQGTASSFDAGVAEAAEILSASRSPLVYGLARSTVASQRAAVALADRLGAYCDPALSDFDRRALVALQSVGISTCTLGEVRQRADVVLFWGCDPMQTHPRLWDRIIEPTSPWLPQGRADRQVFSCQPAATDLCPRADAAIQLDPAISFAVLHRLRAIVKGRRIPTSELPEEITRKLAVLVEQLQTAQYAVVFFGPDLAPTGEQSAHLESLFLLVRDLNRLGRCAAVGLAGPQTESVLTWQTGYPCGVSFAAGYPEYAPMEYSASHLLETGQVDAVVTIGTRSLDFLSTPARERLQQLPWVALTSVGSSPAAQPTVQFVTRHPADAEDLIFRLDGVPLRLPAAAQSSLTTEAEVLARLLTHVS